jgi:hypothetical protein
MTEEELKEKITNILHDMKYYIDDGAIEDSIPWKTYSYQILNLPEIRDGLKLLEMYKNGELPSPRGYDHRREKNDKSLYS